MGSEAAKLGEGGEERERGPAGELPREQSPGAGVVLTAGTADTFQGTAAHLSNSTQRSFKKENA